MRRQRTGALLLAALLVLSACAVSGEPEPEPEWESYQQGLLEVQEPEPEPEEPALPGAFTLAWQQDQTLDPITCGEGIQEDAASLLFESLFRLDRTFTAQPLLCRGYSWDEAGLVCTLDLREDVTFQDGSPLTARDVSDTLRRAAASERYGYRLRGVASVAPNRAGQVVITLTEPNRGLPELLDIPVVKSGTEQERVPVGTGPYRLVSENGEHVLRADPDWWQGKTLPVEAIPLVQAKDRDTALYLFSTHRVELLTVDPTDDLSSVTGQAQSANRPTAILQFIGFNAAEGRLFSSPAARAAFSRGIPRERMADAQLAHLALPAQFPFSPLSPLYPKDLERAYSKEDAQAGLRLAGQDTGETRELTLLVNEEDSFRVTSARFIAQSLSLLDWQITVQVLPWEAYMAALEAGEFDLYFGEVRLTADWDLRDLAGAGGALNYGGFTDPALDEAMAAFAAAGDRPAAARRLAGLLQSAAPIAPVCFKNYTVLTHPGVAEGLDPAPSNTFQGLESWRIRLSG